jgi:hypothetical protein
MDFYILPRRGAPCINVTTPKLGLPRSVWTLQPGRVNQTHRSSLCGPACFPWILPSWSRNFFLPCFTAEAAPVHVHLWPGACKTQYGLVLSQPHLLTFLFSPTTLTSSFPQICSKLQETAHICHRALVPLSPLPSAPQLMATPILPFRSQLNILLLQGLLLTALLTH